MRTYLVRIPRRQGHSIHSDVLAGFPHRWRKPPHPRTDSSWPSREGSRVAARQLRSNNRAEAWLLSSPLCSVPFDSPCGAPTIPRTWAEDRALLRSNLSAVPGANTEWGGTMPPPSIRDWHPSAKSCRLRSSPALAPPPLCAPLFLPFFRSCLRECPALGVGLPLAQHVPDDGGQLPHHGDPGDARPPAPFEALEPLPQPGVPAQHVDRPLRQQPPRHAAARLGDAPQPLVVLAAVAAAGREPPVVGQAVGAGEALDPADPARQRDGREVAHPRHRREEHRLRADAAAPGDHLLQFLAAPLDLLQVGQQVVHLQAVNLGQGELLQPGDACLGRELLGGHLPLQVVPPQDVPDPVDQTRPGPAGVLAQHGQPPVLLVRGAGDVHLAQAADGLALEQAIAVDPQQLAQRGGIAPVGLAELPLFRLDEDHLVAAVVVQHANEPVVKATDLEHGDEGRACGQPLAGELLEEGVDLVGLRRDLPGLHDVPALVAERDGDLPCVLIDAQVQHGWFSSWVVEAKVSYFTLPTRGRTASSQRDPSFTDTKAGWRKSGSCGGGADEWR